APHPLVREGRAPLGERLEQLRSLLADLVVDLGAPLGELLLELLPVPAALLDALGQALLGLGEEAVAVELGPAAHALDRERQAHLRHERNDDGTEGLGGRAGQTLAGHDSSQSIYSLP